MEELPNGGVQAGHVYPAQLPHARGETSVSLRSLRVRSVLVRMLSRSFPLVLLHLPLCLMRLVLLKLAALFSLRFKLRLMCSDFLRFRARFHSNPHSRLSVWFRRCIAWRTFGNPSRLASCAAKPWSEHSALELALC